MNKVVRFHDIEWIGGTEEFPTELVLELPVDADPAGLDGLEAMEEFLEDQTPVGWSWEVVDEDEYPLSDPSEWEVQ